MIRYCQRCKKDFDFNIKSMTELDNLICPQCGQKIDKNSRHPVDRAGTERVEQQIGQAIYSVMRILFFIQIIIAVTGMVAFCLHLYTAVYILTGITVLMFLSRFGRSMYCNAWTFLAMVAGAGIAYKFYETTEGACFGVLAGFAIYWIVIYTIIRWIWRMFWKFMRWCQRQ